MKGRSYNGKKWPSKWPHGYSFYETPKENSLNPVVTRFRLLAVAALLLISIIYSHFHK